MRIPPFVALLLVTTASMAPQPATAFPDSPSNYPWCATFYDSSFGGRFCSYASYGQCMATISGVGGICTQNLLYAPPPRYAARHRAKKSHNAGEH
jgi:Protein of unknown function (DUF3551)